MTKDDRGNLDLTKQIEIKDKEIETLNSVVVNLKNIIDSKEAEMTAMINANQSHKEFFYTSCFPASVKSLLTSVCLTDKYRSRLLYISFAFISWLSA